MTAHFESELKYGLKNLEDMRALQRATGSQCQARHRQCNHFFAPQTVTLPYLYRLRQEDERFILTVKTGGGGQGFFKTRREEEVEISAAEAAYLLQGKEQPPDMLLAKRPDLRDDDFGRQLAQDARQFLFGYLGCFSNIREVYKLDLATTRGRITLFAEFDSATFPDGRTDYEVEIEVTREIAEEADSLFRNLLRMWQIEITPMTSKAGRFFATLKRPQT